MTIKMMEREFKRKLEEKFSSKCSYDEYDDAMHGVSRIMGRHVQFMIPESKFRMSMLAEIESLFSEYYDEVTESSVESYLVQMNTLDSTHMVTVNLILKDHADLEDFVKEGVKA